MRSAVVTLPKPLGSWYRNRGREHVRAHWPRHPHGYPRILRVLRRKVREKKARDYVRFMHKAIGCAA